MGHHHRHRRDNRNDTQPQSQRQEQGNLSLAADMPDVGSMLKNLNLGDIDLSKVDMNKVQSIMDRMQNQGTAVDGGSNPASALLSGTSSGNTGMLELLKEMVPQRKAHKLDKLLKLMKLTGSMNTAPGLLGTNRYSGSIRNEGRHRHR